jgi:hypothetical protein
LAKRTWTSLNAKLIAKEKMMAACDVLAVTDSLRTLRVYVAIK